MMEAHLMLKKDEPPIITVVLCKARVLIIYDWLDNFKNFLLLTSGSDVSGLSFLYNIFFFYF